MKKHDETHEVETVCAAIETSDKEAYEAPRLQRHEPLLDVTAAQAVSPVPAVKDR